MSLRGKWDGGHGKTTEPSCFNQMIGKQYVMNEIYIHISKVTKN